MAMSRATRERMRHVIDIWEHDAERTPVSIASEYAPKWGVKQSRALQIIRRAKEAGQHLPKVDVPPVQRKRKSSSGDKEAEFAVLPPARYQTADQKDAAVIADLAPGANMPIDPSRLPRTREEYEEFGRREFASYEEKAQYMLKVKEEFYQSSGTAMKHIAELYKDILSEFEDFSGKPEDILIETVSTMDDA